MKLNDSAIDIKCLLQSVRDCEIFIFWKSVELALFSAGGIEIDVTTATCMVLGFEWSGAL